MKFENLIRDPENHIKQLCDFLEVDFDNKMLEQIVVSKGFKAGQVGFDTGAADRWKKYIDLWINRWFKFWFRKYMSGLGYTDQPEKPLSLNC